MTVYFLLAAYNEGERPSEGLGRYSGRKIQFDYKILVVDDGSSDNTGNIALKYASRLPVELVSHNINRDWARFENRLYELERQVERQ